MIATNTSLVGSTMVDKSARLSDEDFAQLVRFGPLIAIDLIVRKTSGAGSGWSAQL